MFVNIGNNMVNQYILYMYQWLYIRYGCERRSQDYNLNRVYMFGDEILNNKQCISLWMLSFIGHIFRYTTSKFK